MILSHKKTRAFCVALFLVGMAFLTFYQSFWPWILVVIGVVLAFRSFALGKIYEAIFNFLTFGTLTATYFLQISWSIVLPIILVVTAIFEIYKAYNDEVVLSDEEIIEDKQHELEENKD